MITLGDMDVTRITMMPLMASTEATSLSKGNQEEWLSRFQLSAFNFDLSSDLNWII